MSTRIRAAALAVLAVAPSPVLAQGSSPFSPTTTSFDLPSTLGPYRRIAVADVTGDGLADVVAAGDGGTAMLHGFERYVADAIPLPVLASDLAVWTNATPEHTAALFTAGSDGVHLWTWDPAENAFPAAAAALVPGAWTEPDLVACRDFGTDFGVSVVYDAADGTLHPTVWSQAAGTVFFTPPSFAVGPDVEDLAIVHWDADGSPEICVAVSGTLLFYTLAGQFVDMRATGHHTGRVAVLTSSPGERVAWVVGHPTLTTELHVVAEAGDAVPLSLPGLDVATLSAADQDGDGLDDLVLGLAGGGSAALLRQQPATGFHGAVPVVVPGPSSEAAPALRDVEGDGDADLVVLDSGAPALVQHVGSAASPADGRYDILSAAYFAPQAPGEVVDLLLSLEPPSELPQDATGVEVLAHGLLSDTDPLTGVLAGYASADLPDVAVQIDLDPVAAPGELQRYLLEIRPFRAVPGEPRVAYASAFFTFETDPEAEGPFFSGSGPRIGGIWGDIPNPPDFGEGEVPPAPMPPDQP